MKTEGNSVPGGQFFESFICFWRAMNDGKLLETVGQSFQESIWIRDLLDDQRTRGQDEPQKVVGLLAWVASRIQEASDMTLAGGKEASSCLALAMSLFFTAVG
eukprot:CAMPEP_0194751874 /NCGR_PEP_ID=MMETSP0323_2-20130528/5794_1 /TAXON_ID=2866 ORGANISM="Crypthecodinium cohnii, Strain Seligo" /NCGR_SAMPLE_ID=MMETSP0323_2 /ASSEMBLY_ACC=CAM_ASM_000346 /LENGTH=102 /DNA_ID=CAMNT_0039668537 /DNA_START=777 /DNA_END=1083 /DNA_ORIENTATION=+